MAYTNFTPTGYGAFDAPQAASANVAIPNTAATLLVTNLGPNPAVVLLGGSTVTVTIPTGIAISVGQFLPLAVGSNTYIAGIGVGGPAMLNLAQGT